MANLGTPFVIGTLTATTNTTTFVVPITTANGTPANSDTFAVYVSTGTVANSAATVVSVSDTKGNSYAQINTSNTTHVLSEWRAVDGVALTSSDTVTVTLSAANGLLKNIIVVDLPGVATYYGGIDQAISNATTGGNITISETPTEAYEIITYATASGNGGGVPVPSGNVTLLSTVHSGSGQYLQVSYAIVTTAATVNITSTIVGGQQWSALATTTQSNNQPQWYQQPFPVNQLNATLAFNPAYTGLRPQSGQISPAITGNVSFAGSQTNITKGIPVNLLTGNSTTFAGSLGGWSGGTSVTLNRSSVIFRVAGNQSVAIISNASGARSVLSSSTGNLTTNGFVVNPGDTVFTSAWFQAGSTSRSIQAGFDFFDVNSTVIGGTILGNSFNDSVGQWIYVYAETTVPAGAYYCRCHHTIGTTATSEIHYMSDPVFSDLTTSSSPGSVAIYQTFWPQFPLAPDGIPFPLSFMPSLAGLQRQVATSLQQSFTTGVASGVTVAAPPGGTLIYTPFYDQFPFPPILPAPLQYNPAYFGLRQQYNTGNAFTYIDGGQATGQVTVNGNFPDMGITISVSPSTPNVSVVVPSPPTILNGPVSTVNVAAPAGVVNIKVSGVVTNNNVVAPAGSLSANVIGVVSNVAVASSGVVKLGPANQTVNVSVVAPAGSLSDKILGTVSNVAVASTGVAVVTPQGVTTNISVAAPAGSLKVSIPGSVSNVSVASTGIASIVLPGPVSNISVAAPSGTTVISKVVNGVTANVRVTSSGISTVILTGVSTAITARAPSGSIAISVSVPTSNVQVTTPAGYAGQIAVTGNIIDPDEHMELLLSAEGRLMEIPVENMLVSATEPVQSQGI